MTDLAADFGLVSEADAMHFRGVAKRTLSNERAQGKGPPFVRVGKKIYYPLDGLREYVAKNTITPVHSATLIHGRRRVRVRGHRP